jgi:hypothetical protein
MRLRPKRCMFCSALPLPLAFRGAGAANGAAPAGAEGFSVALLFLVSKGALVRGCGIQYCFANWL